MQMQYVQFDIDDNIGVITLNRPEAANAQSPAVLEELDLAWNTADQDERVKVIVFRSNGKHFSAGHDISGTDARTDSSVYKADILYDWETRRYLHYAKSWRNVPKPSIAAVQGKCIAAGLMLCWPCDLIVAAENAEFSDPVLHMGILGVELHAHAWELGPRKAKELLFTACSITAQEAMQLGMVNKVVSLEQLMPATFEMARRIACVDSFALRMAKRAVNHTMDIQGYTAAIDSCFDMHHLGHARAALVTGGMPSLAGLSSMKERGK